MHAARGGRRFMAASLSALLATAIGAGLAGSVGARAPGSADLAVGSSDSSDPVAAGAPLEYSISIDDAGPDAAVATVLENKLPRGVDFVSAGASQGSCERKGRNVNCELGDLLRDAFAPVTVTLRMNAPAKAGTITNQATVSSDAKDPVAANDSVSESTTVVDEEPLECRGAVPTIVGTEAGEVLRGTTGRDVILAGGGADTVRARGGNDLVCGGSGDDRLRGADGGDRLIGGNGRDRISGQGGNDELRGGRKADRLRGGPGNDVLKAGRGRDRCNGGAGRDVKRRC